MAIRWCECGCGRWPTRASPSEHDSEVLRMLLHLEGVLDRDEPYRGLPAPPRLGRNGRNVHRDREAARRDQHSPPATRCRGSCRSGCLPAGRARRLRPPLRRNRRRRLPLSARRSWHSTSTLWRRGAASTTPTPAARPWRRRRHEGRAVREGVLPGARSSARAGSGSGLTAAVAPAGRTARPPCAAPPDARHGTLPRPWGAATQATLHFDKRGRRLRFVSEYKGEVVARTRAAGAPISPDGGPARR